MSENFYQKCFSCGYEYEERENEEDYTINIIKGSEKFYRLINQEFNFITDYRQHYGQNDIIETKTIYACPECGLLKIEV